MNTLSLTTLRVDHIWVHHENHPLLPRHAYKIKYHYSVPHFINLSPSPPRRQRLNRALGKLHKDHPA